MSEHSLELSGSTVHYWEYPALPCPADNSPAPLRTVLVVHGFRGDHHGLERVVEALPGLRVLMPDLPGFGESEAFPSREHNIAGYTEFLQEFMTALGLDERTVLLGHSFGSIVASHFVAEHPGRVAELILINPIAAPALEGPKGVLSKLAQFYYWAAAKLPEKLGQALLRSKLIVQVMSVSMAKTKDPELLEFIHGQHHAYFSSFAHRDMLLEAFKASISGNVRQVAEQLRLPTLLIAGEKDEIAALPAQHALLERLPQAELSVIDGVGHLIHYETPAEAAQAIKAFLAAHPDPSEAAS
ncbi:pimeloyl-ACP methyl ester carboxylesterase [Psychromicrobium silvestre]|uniref:Pimeloyl-ACP methyl ester carboxylesterase n=1 Tax=Psychromicrobium silvestre TaxID=1645614 RepID=A0A7Y9S4D3_9MICC|nr:pimeloyl-ACP methyl ester carboxylesterase [Psychromicrobium silvestre]